ncbi:phosphate acyltransferase PlsX [Collinsella sp. zg1085]|uniref:phosphate acyltransferase PlsX n=1 Tax=Collinsella sp. zg1085 TaxID=2844380 RepID=UPI001C0C6341|nr:phosphate acyltransferase PlsX [Collinsella sp. zg1085]QWT17122.1 phosphate acyltransferase PlsX [Collinsella sp. zg1085]
MNTQAPVRLVVDAMGGDEEPQVVLAGIAAALEADSQLTVLVAGPESVILPFCEAHERAEALVAPDTIDMEDDPIQAVLTKRKSSIVVGCRAIKQGRAAGIFSAGSTGACVAAGTAYITPFKVLENNRKQPIRPCIISAIPTQAGGLTVFCDLGANPDAEPVDVVRFAKMGCAYAKVVLGIEQPRVALLSNGTEDHKGSQSSLACFEVCKYEVPNFVGNAEATDLTNGRVDVVVADGFVGNIALKATEGAAKLLLHELKAAFNSSLLTKLAGLLMRRKLRAVKDMLSGDVRGGAMLVGLKGVMLIGHGATSATAVKNGTLACASAIRAGLVQKVAHSIDEIVE